jgi:hypothetical protein
VAVSWEHVNKLSGLHTRLEIPRQAERLEVSLEDHFSMELGEKYSDQDPNPELNSMAAELSL